MIDKRTILYLAVAGAMFIILVFLIMSRGPGGVPSGETLRELAIALENKELYAQAIEEYENYLLVSDLGEEKKARIHHKIGTIYMDKLHDYENALAAFVKVKHLASEGSLTREVDRRMVECLDRMGRSLDAQQELERATTLEEEGVVLEPFRLVRRGRFDEARLRALLAGARFPARSPDDNVAELEAMVAANRAGVALLRELVAEHGDATVATTMRQLQQAAAGKVAREIERLPDGVHRFADRLDDGTPVAVSLEIAGPRMVVDFAGTGLGAVENSLHRSGDILKRELGEAVAIAAAVANRLALTAQIDRPDLEASFGEMGLH